MLKMCECYACRNTKPMSDSDADYIAKSLKGRERTLVSAAHWSHAVVYVEKLTTDQFGNIHNSMGIKY
jgi:hypothetical protein